MFTSRIDRVIGVVAVAGLLILGAGEMIARLDEPAPLFFWLPTLWGGAALILTGGFLVERRTRPARALVLFGCAAGLMPSLWTLVMPALLATLAIRAVTATRPIDEPVGET